MITKSNLKSTTKLTSAQKKAGMTADPKKEGIPVELQTQNRQPPSPEAQARVDAMMKKAQEAADAERKYFDKPKGMTVEEWEAHLKSKEEAKAAEKASRESNKAERAPRESKKRLREGKVSVAQIAQEMGILPRVARGMLRDAEWKKPEGGWVYDPTDTKSIDAVKALLAAGPKKEKKKEAPKVEEASRIKGGGVFTSKLKKTKAKVVPVVGDKAKAKAEAKKAIAATKKATGKKPVVTKVPTGATSKK